MRANIRNLKRGILLDQIASDSGTRFWELELERLD
jgi:hypothetical protein